MSQVSNSFPSFIILPNRLKKYKERLDLTLLIEYSGLPISSYSLYRATGRSYIITKESSSRYNEYVRRGRKYDVQGPSSLDIQSILREQQRLDVEEEEAIAKILRLRKQKRFLSKRMSKMISYSLKTLDKLNTKEEKERLEREARERLESENSNPSASTNLFSSIEFPSPSDPFQSSFDSRTSEVSSSNPIGSLLVPTYRLPNYVLSI